MLELILKVIRAILASLYMLFEGVPALEALRSWFGDRGGPGGNATALLMLLAAAALLGVLIFLFSLWLLRKRPVDAATLPPAPAPPPAAGGGAGASAGDGP